jgi:hypothetical protein
LFLGEIALIVVPVVGFIIHERPSPGTLLDFTIGIILRVVKMSGHTQILRGYGLYRSL